MRQWQQFYNVQEMEEDFLNISLEVHNGKQAQQRVSFGHARLREVGRDLLCGDTVRHPLEDLPHQVDPVDHLVILYGTVYERTNLIGIHRFRLAISLDDESHVSVLDGIFYTSP